MKHVKARVKLREINGMMHYYYSEKRSSVILELKKGKVVKLHLSDPEKNEQFVQELESQMRVLEKMEKIKQKNKKKS